MHYRTESVGYVWKEMNRLIARVCRKLVIKLLNIRDVWIEKESQELSLYYHMVNSQTRTRSKEWSAYHSVNFEDKA